MRPLLHGRRELERRAGNLSQFLGVEELRLSGGRADGMRALLARDGCGLEFLVLPDRGLDIARLSCDGIDLAWQGSPGLTAPSYHEPEGLGFLRGFHGGLLTTCGLRNVGSPCAEGGEHFGLHGRASFAPAEAVSADVDWSGPLPKLRVVGRTREARVFGENLVLERRISCECGGGVVRIEDRVENRGFREEELYLLYHFNLGFPLLDSGSRLVAASRAARPRDAAAERGISSWAECAGPTPGFAEEVFYHEMATNARGWASCALVNDRLGLGLAIRYDARTLPNLTQWKMLGEGEYAMGIEPCNCLAEGRSRSREAGLGRRLCPGESASFELEVEILEGPEAISGEARRAEAALATEGRR